MNLDSLQLPDFGLDASGAGAGAADHALTLTFKQLAGDAGAITGIAVRPAGEPPATILTAGTLTLTLTF